LATNVFAGEVEQFEDGLKQTWKKQGACYQEIFDKPHNVSDLITKRSLILLVLFHYFEERSRSSSAHD